MKRYLSRRRWHVPWPGASWYREGSWQANGEWGFYCCTRHGRFRWLAYARALRAVVVYRLFKGPWGRRQVVQNSGAYLVPWWIELLDGDRRLAWLNLRDGVWW